MVKKRSQQSKMLVENMAKLFASMILANRKYVDPTSVLKSLTDDFGNQVHVGEQKDLGEFNINFLERIEEGLGEKHQENPDSVQLFDDVSPSIYQQTSSSFDLSEIGAASLNADLLLAKTSSSEEAKSD